MTNSKSSTSSLRKIAFAISVVLIPSLLATHFFPSVQAAVIPNDQQQQQQRQQPLLTWPSSWSSFFLGEELQDDVAQSPSLIPFPWTPPPQDEGYTPARTNFTDWSCQLSDRHPYPVVILHGLLAPFFKSWAFMAEKLAEEGYCVYQLKYGMLEGYDTVGGLKDIRESAKELDAFVDRVLDITGTDKIDLIGHSEGTVVSRWYLKFLRGHEKVRSVVSISPIGSGTSIQGLLGVSKVTGIFETFSQMVGLLCPACTQLLQGSELMAQLMADGPDILPGLRYLNIMTRKDQLVTPFTNGMMRFQARLGLLAARPIQKVSPAGKVKDEKEEEDPDRSNLIIEDHCPDDLVHSNHFSLFRSPFALTATDAFLSTDSTWKPTRCSL